MGSPSVRDNCLEHGHRRTRSLVTAELSQLGRRPCRSQGLAREDQETEPHMSEYDRLPATEVCSSAHRNLALHRRAPLVPLGPQDDRVGVCHPTLLVGRIGGGR